MVKIDMKFKRSMVGYKYDNFSWLEQITYINLILQFKSVCRFLFKMLTVNLKNIYNTLLKKLSVIKQTHFFTTNQK